MDLPRIVAAFGLVFLRTDGPAWVAMGVVLVLSGLAEGVVSGAVTKPSL